MSKFSLYNKWDIYSEDFHLLSTHIMAYDPESAVEAYIEDEMLFHDIEDGIEMTFFVAEHSEKDLYEVKASAEVTVDINWCDIVDTEDYIYTPEQYRSAEKAGLNLPNRPVTTSDVPKEQLHFDFFEKRNVEALPATEAKEEIIKNN